ncbi:MAG: amidohydrolase family protein, partial [Acidimicrobiia bacterium]|nr:amidohydrolase family protein [Acidimicrobiia bacterium]
MTTRFVNGRFPDGSTADLLADRGVFTTDQGDVSEQVDLAGRMVLPAFGEPHAHLDKAMLAERFPNPSGDLVGAIEVMRVGWSMIEHDDVVDRATQTVRRLVAAGTTLIRSHADTTVYAGLKAVRALLAVRDAVEPICDLEVVAMAYPLTGPDGHEGRRILDQAIELGADVIGGAPHLEDDPISAIDHLLNLAVETRLHVDLHVDEVLDPGYDTLRDLSRAVIRHGLEGTVNASHCVSHGLKPEQEQREIAAALAHADITVVALPRTNLYLQARGRHQAPPRGTVGVEAMHDAGVTVGGGADNCQDPFYSIGKCDPLETAGLLVSVCHQTMYKAFEM